MAFMGILLVDLIFFGIFIAVCCGLLAVTVWSLVALISGIVLTVKGNASELKSKEKILGIVLLIVGSTILVTAAYVIFRLVQMFQ